ncbi:MAG: vWA domain-containing protein, partial [Actinomycetota bacterium]
MSEATEPGLGVDPDAGIRVAVALSQAVRAAGVPVSTGSSVVLADALSLTGLGDRTTVFRVGRAVCCTDREHYAGYATAFAAVFGDAEAASAETGPAAAAALGFDGADPEDPGARPETAAGETLAVRWSRAEVLRTRDFADYSPADLAEARRLMARLASAGATRRTARLVPASGVTRRPDLRRTARRALRTGGEAVRPAHRERSERPRRLVLLLDVSGSMEPYARAYVQFLQAAVAGRREVEAFAVGTRLTRITRELAGRDPDAAVVAAARRVVDWSGGTRLGDGIRRFNDEWGIRGVARGAVVVVVSDGWDRGDPERLGSELARLKRVAHRIIWV